MRMKSKKLSEVHQIEVTTICNLRCKYCPHPKMKREKAHMKWETYVQAIEFAKPFYEMGTQRELSLTGIGESTMHPDFIRMLELARKTFPKIRIGFSTNGMPTFTEAIAQACADNKIDVFVSLHRPEVAGRAIELARKHGVFATYNPGAAVSSMDWAGQVDWPVSAPKTVCAYLALGWAVVLSDGSVTTCCLDAEKKGIIGTVWDDPLTLEVKPYVLCETCHEAVPTEKDLLLMPREIFVPWGT